MLDIPSYLLGKKAGGGEGGTSNYNDLSNKPSINDVTLTGNKTTADLGIVIPTKTSDLTNDGTNASYTSMLHYGLTNEENSGLYFGSGNDVRVRKSISSSEYNDTYLEVQANKVTSISSSSTDSEYPSAKAVYDNSLDVYSTTERRIGTWIDGKPLYKQTIHYSTAITSTSTNIAHGISNIDRVISATGFAPYGTDQCYMIPAFQDNSRHMGISLVDSTNIVLNVGSGWQSSFSNGCYITLQYTKTTD